MKGAPHFSYDSWAVSSLTWPSASPSRPWVNSRPLYPHPLQVWMPKHPSPLHPGGSLPFSIFIDNQRAWLHSALFLFGLLGGPRSRRYCLPPNLSEHCCWKLRAVYDLVRAPALCCWCWLVDTKSLFIYALNTHHDQVLGINLHELTAQ
jgi:hypothetical protein